MMQMPLFFRASTVCALCATDIAKIFQRFSPCTSSSLRSKKMAHDSEDAFIHRSTMRARPKSRNHDDWLRAQSA